MSSNGYALPLRIPVKTSPWLVGCLLIAHTGVAVIVLRLNAPGGLTALLTLLLLYSAYHYLRPMPARQAVVDLLLKDTGKVLVGFSNGEYCQAEILGDSYIHPWLVIVNLKLAGGGRLSIPLLRDHVEEDQHRQLRLYLCLQQYRLTAEKRKQPL